MSPLLLLGVDAGGTSCRARLAGLDGVPLAEARGGPANILSDPVGAWSSIEQAIAAVFKAAGHAEGNPSQVIAAFGLAGLNAARPEAPPDWPLARFRACRTETDAYIAQVGAFAGGDGAVLIIGTGSVGLLVRGGEQTSVGGYGAAVSDEGSGAWIGREAVRRALWAFDQRRPGSHLAARILAAVGTPPTTQAWAHAARPADYAALAPVVLKAAAAGDRQAVDILEEAAAHLERILLRLADAGARQACLMGGLAGALRPWLKTQALKIVQPRGTALDGALRLARQMALGLTESRHEP